jgi:ribonuclease P protein component
LTAERLPKSSRLTRAVDLRALLSQGKRQRTDHLDLFTRPSPVGSSRLAVIVPRLRHTAVRRNLLRRRLREIGRRSVLPRLTAPLDIAVRARAVAYAAPFAALHAELVEALCPRSPGCSS